MGAIGEAHIKVAQNQMTADELASVYFEASLVQGFNIDICKLIHCHLVL